MHKKDFYKIGNITRVNRKTGELSIAPESKSLQIEDDLQTIFIEIDGGLVPFFVSETGAVNSEMIRVLLEDYASPDLAQRFVGCRVFLPAGGAESLPLSDQLEMEDIIGFSVVDDALGEIGIIHDVFESPQQILLQILNQGKEMLIPLVEEFLVDLDEEKRTILFRLPDGLLDINVEK